MPRLPSSGCENFNKEPQVGERDLLICSLVQRLNAEAVTGEKTDRGLEIVMLLCNWNSWRDTRFHVDFPLFQRPLRDEVEALINSAEAWDSFCSP
jgi:hypothetical protein